MTAPVEIGLCECGCGQKAAIAKRNHASGIRKGEPMRFIAGHHSRVMERKPLTAEARTNMSAAQRRRFEDPAERQRLVALNVGRKQTDEHRARTSSSLKGRTFTPEHLEKLRSAGRRRFERERPQGDRAPRWKGDEAGYVAIHTWLRKQHPKTGTCEECGANVGAEGQHGTHYAFRHHGTPYTRDREDYRELCPACHVNFDAEWRAR